MKCVDLRSEVVTPRLLGTGLKPSGDAYVKSDASESDASPRGVGARVEASPRAFTQGGSSSDNQTALKRVHERHSSKKIVRGASLGEVSIPGPFLTVPGPNNGLRRPNTTKN